MIATSMTAIVVFAEYKHIEIMQLRDYQKDIADKAVNILRSKMIVYIAAEVRTGKTLMSLETAKLYGAKNVLFLTKKKAISSIKEDYDIFRYSDHFELTVCNNESMHKVPGRFDLVIHDESHRFGSFPKPSNGAKLFKSKYSKLPLILLSGTPTPEGYSQIYHQFWISAFSPFPHLNFYKWARDYVNVKQRNLGYGMVNDYSAANKEKIDKVISPYMVTFTQKKAGFTSTVTENVLTVKMNDITYKIADQLKKDLMIQGSSELILADTSVKLMNKLHQIYSGTIKFESGNRKVLDLSKAEYIKNHFTGHKIGIFYKFTAELEALKTVFGELLTTDLDEFNTTNKSIALQIVSGREGISLKNAKYLVYYNIDYSATSYWQSRDRLTTMERLSNEIFYVFSEGGIESNIYKAVQSKKNYTLSHFKKDYNVKIPSKNHQRV